MMKIELDLVATGLSFFINSILVILKLVFGIMFSSISLIADGFDSLLDLVMTIFAGVGERISKKPADDTHPFGHAKFQFIFSLAIVVIMIFSAYEIGREAIIRISNREILEFKLIILIIAGVSIVGKLFLSIIMERIGKKIKSPVIIATAKNFRADVLASFLVCIAVVGSYLRLWWVDPICAILIVAIIVITGYQIAKESLPALLDRAPPEKILNEVKEIASTFSEVKEIHLIRLREVLGAYTGDFHILLNPSLTILKGHEIAEKLKEKIEKTGKYSNLIVHIEPYIPEEIVEGNN